MGAPSDVPSRPGGWAGRLVAGAALTTVATLVAQTPAASSAAAQWAAHAVVTRPAPTTTTAVPDSAPDVLVIGDSTTVHMRALFRAALAANGLDATVDAKSGRTTREGRLVLAGYDLSDFDYVVVLLGANGNRANAMRDMRALKAAGVDTMATVQAPEQATVNRAVRRVFGTERITWAGYASRHGIRTTDGKHYSPQDYAARAQYIARQIAQRAAA